MNVSAAHPAGEEEHLLPEPDPKTFRVSNAFASTLTTVGWTEFSLSIGLAEHDGDMHVLFPVIDCGLYGTDNSEEPLWAGRLPFDNLAHMISQAASGMADAVTPLADILAGPLKLPGGRLEYATERLEAAVEHLQEAIAKLQEVSSRSAGQVEPETEVTDGLA